jgi:hypothetical protein
MIMKSLLLATALALVAIAPASAGDLTATITQATLENAKSNWYSILIVVDNNTNRRFEQTKWNCLFYSNNQIVGQEDIFVEANEAGKQSAKTWHVTTFKPFDKSECGLTHKQ